MLESVGPSHVGKLPHGELNLMVVQSKFRVILKEFQECIKP